MTKAKSADDASNRVHSEIGNLRSTSQLTCHPRRLQKLKKHAGLIGTVDRLATAVKDYTTIMRGDMANLHQQMQQLRQDQQQQMDQLRQDQQKNADRLEIRDFQLCAWEAAVIVRDKVAATAGVRDFWDLDRERQDHESKALGISVKTLRQFLQSRRDDRPTAAHPSTSLIAERWREVKPALVRQQPKTIKDYEKLLRAAGVIRTSSRHVHASPVLPAPSAAVQCTALPLFCASH